jgi:hypothetical protein
MRLRRSIAASADELALLLRQYLELERQQKSPNTETTLPLHQLQAVDSESEASEVERGSETTQLTLV